MALRPEFREAIGLLAQAVAIAVEKGAGQPVLVGGAAVELYTSGAVTSGDFDLVTPDHEILAAALEDVGFERRAKTALQLSHPKLHIAVEFVAGQLMEGKADLKRVRGFQIDDHVLRVIPVEDLIADRLGQAFSVTSPRKDMLDQAVKLFAVAATVDRTYLDKRVWEETSGQADLAFLERLADADRKT